MAMASMRACIIKRGFNGKAPSVMASRRSGYSPSQASAVASTTASIVSEIISEASLRMVAARTRSNSGPAITSRNARPRAMTKLNAPSSASAVTAD